MTRSLDALRAPMDCAELQRSVEAYVDGEFEAREQAEAEAHLAGCERCRALSDGAASLRAAMRARLQEAMGPAAAAGRAPELLRRRVTVALSRQRRPLWRRILSPVPLATAAACAAGVLVVLATHVGSDALVEEAVKKHHRGLPLEVTTASMGAEAIPGWFAGKLDFKPTPPSFQRDGAKVVGARLSHLREFPAAYIKYELPRGQAGLFIVDDPGRHFEANGREVQVGPRTLRVMNSRGYNVAVWRQDEIVYSLVSDLGEDDLFELVRSAQAR
ncbi:MAG: zf-HC2 domain-containing protein [Anaeromyxobacter sp.]|nr:zf-HC2 domain-containing protein [Anaeromyxobacter sp.]MBL0274782.1 zf-HC2 domain-containing protein [Anaeromyxobacter sp.]